MFRCGILNGDCMKAEHNYISITVAITELTSGQKNTAIVSIAMST